MKPVERAKIDELSQEVASLTRVRNRLTNASDSQLPKILSALLPRLLNRMEIYTIGQYSDQSIQDVCQSAQDQVSGILSHSLERLRGNCSIPVVGIIEELLPFLLSENIVVSTWAMIFIQGGIQRCNAKSLPNDTEATLIRCIDSLHAKAVRETTKASHARITSVSWLLLDCIAMRTGVQPLIDWDLDSFADQEPRWSCQQSSMWKAIASTSAIQAAEFDGSGIFHLLLDLFLFWPSESALLSGLSKKGEERLLHRSRTSIEKRENRRTPFGPQPSVVHDKWSEMALKYLRFLKLACLRYSVWPSSGGLFQGPQSGRALVIAVLLSSNNSMHGRLANDYVNTYRSRGNPSLSKKETTRLRRASCPFKVMCALLILIVGDEKAFPLLDEFKKRQGQAPWESIIGRIPSHESLQRPSLPLEVAARAVDFLMDSPLTLSQDAEEVQLLIDLTSLMATLRDRSEESQSKFSQRRGKFWAMGLLEVIYNDLSASSVMKNEDKKMCTIAKTCLEVALSVISVVVEVGKTSVEREMVPTHQLPLGGAVPFSRRDDFNRLMDDHRMRQKRRKLCEHEAVKAREIAYDVISKFATQRMVGDERPFELPICLLHCAVYENVSMHSFVKKANDALLSAYQEKEWISATQAFVVEDNEFYRQNFVVPLLPALLDAVCSDSTLAKTVALDWIGRFLRRLDPQAAKYLSTILAHDIETKVSSAARATATSIQTPLADLYVEERKHVFLDTSSEKGMRQIEQAIHSRIEEVSIGLCISRSLAESLLYDYKFSVENILSNKANAIERMSGSSGLLQEYGVTPDIPKNVLCSICYDSVECHDAYALACGHNFCIACWQQYLSAAKEDGKYNFLETRCPQQDCNARVTQDDMRNIDPEASVYWTTKFKEAFLDLDPAYCVCPKPSCKYIVESEKPGQQDHGTECKCEGCSAMFCFSCGEPPHQPATCSDLLDWNRVQAKSDFWVKKNAKPCPGCHSPIEKNQGCNHMTCNCGIQFCWLCLTVLSRHSEEHTCNRYDPSGDVADDDERRALFVAERFDAHSQAEKFTLKQYRDVEKKPQKLIEIFSFLTLEDERILRHALETLADARHFLKNSYIAAYGLRRRPQELCLFEDYQSALEMLTERLSQLTETNLQRVHLEKGEFGVKGHFHCLGFYRVFVANYMKRFLSAKIKMTELRRRESTTMI